MTKQIIFELDDEVAAKFNALFKRGERQAFLSDVAKKKVEQHEPSPST